MFRSSSSIRSYSKPLGPGCRRRSWVMLGAAAAFAALVAAGSAVASDRQMTKAVVRLKWVHQAQFAGFYAAQEKGLYHAAGLDVEIRPGGVDFPAIQMVASGSEDFGVAGADQILLARAKGVPVVALATIYRRTPFVLFALKKSGIANMKDFVGRQVGVKLGGNEELTYRAMLKSAGVDGSKVHEIPVKYDISPLLAGKIDVWPGYVINEVLAAQEKGAELNVIHPGDYNINFYADTLFTRESVIKNNPGLVKAFVQATMSGWAYAIAHPDEAADFGRKFGHELNAAHERAMMNASIPLLRPNQPPLGKMEVDEWRSLHDQLVALGFLKHPVDLDQAYTNRFLIGAANP
jgi:NitT/TauT family transport system substrate-binding protein